MALPLLLRSLKPQGLQCLTKNTPLIYNNAAKYTQLSSKNLFKKSLNNTQAGVIVTIPKRTIHDHSFMWTVEKLVSASLLIVVPAGIIAPNVVLDNIMAVLITAHSHWGIEAIVLDYVRPIIFGPVIPKLAFFAVYLLSAVTLGGLLYFNNSNIGIGKGIQRLWKGKEE